MNLLSPWPALMAAAIAVPLLLVLYMLKLRRQRLAIPSTMLWTKSFEDLQANAPWQRLRFTPLFLLQLLLLLALLLAFAEPVSETDAPYASRVILLIDRSASMSATDAPAPPGEARTRLDAARAEAVELVERLTESSRPARVMVLAFGADAGVVSNFTNDRRLLIDRIRDIEPTDEAGDLQAALDLAASFAARTDESGDGPPDVVLLSDGVYTPPAGESFRLPAGSFRFIRIGPPPDAPPDNVGIVAFSARRDYDDPTRVGVFARLINAAPHDRQVVAKLFIDDAAAAIRMLDLPAATEDGPGEATLSETLDLPRGAVLRLEHNARDTLAADNTAAVVLPEPRQPRIALVHPPRGPDPFVLEILDATEPQTLRRLTLDAWTASDGRGSEAGASYDFVVFDSVDPPRLPGIPSLTLGGVPADLGEAHPPSREGGSRVLSWDRRHPLMRYVSLDAVVYSGFGGYDLPPTATPLALGPDGPVIATLTANGARHVLVGFMPQHSNWPLDISFAVFIQNVLDDSVFGGLAGDALVARPGEPVTASPASPDVRELRVRGPLEIDVPVGPDGRPRALPRLTRVGVYHVEGAAPPRDRVAVSLLEERETILTPRDAVVVNAEPARAGSVSGTVPRDLWRWVVGIAFAIAVVEWLAYCLRMRT